MNSLESNARQGLPLLAIIMIPLMSTETLSAQTMALDEPTLQALAGWEGAHSMDRQDLHGVVKFDNGIHLYLFGPTQDVEEYIQSELRKGSLAGVLIDQDGNCLGYYESIANSIHAFRTGLSNPGESPDIDSVMSQASKCKAPAISAEEIGWLAANQSNEARSFHSDIPAQHLEVRTPAACTASCGQDDRSTYAGQEAFSNGSDTGKSSSCTYSNCSCGGTGTYGLKYQCVEYTERVHQRSDWAGNAYTGYWSQTGLSASSSSQGPYYKSLLPLGNGTIYAAPQAGDIVVWNKSGTYGHVGVISAVSGTTVTIFDQNRGCGDQSCTLTYSNASPWTLSNGSATGSCGAEGISSYTIAGYLHRGWDFGGTYGLASDPTTGQNQHNWWLNDAKYVSGTTSGSVSDITDYVTFDPGSTDPYLTSPSGLNLPAYSSTATWGYRYFNVYIQSNCSSKTAQLFWKRVGDANFDSTRSVSATISGSGWQSLKFNASSSANWSGTIDQIRIDPAASCSSASTDTISIQSGYFWK